MHDDVIKWTHFPRYWPFVRGIHRSPVNSPHKGQWRGALMFSLICTWINGWVNNREAIDLWRHRAHHDVTVMDMLNFVQHHIYSCFNIWNILYRGFKLLIVITICYNFIGHYTSVKKFGRKLFTLQYTVVKCSCVRYPLHTKPRDQLSCNCRLKIQLTQHAGGNGSLAWHETRFLCDKIDQNWFGMCISEIICT